MKKINNQWAVVALIASVALLFGCHPDDGTGGLGIKPKAKFTATVSDDGYTVTIANSVPGTTAYWKIPGMGINDYKSLSTSNTFDMRFTFPDTYTITMLIAGHGGIDSTSLDVVTTAPDPDACKSTTALGFLASCTQRTWKLLPDAGAYKVGPAANDGSWWSNGTGDVTARSCEFDDEYTFVFGKAHTFIYNSHGDFYGDGYMGDTSNSGCQPESNFTATEAPWGSGTFHFIVLPGGSAGLGQLTLSGLGAHMGLQKVTTNAENTSGPVSSITYDILSMTGTGVAGDVLVIGANMGWGWWTFTFQAQ